MIYSFIGPPGSGKGTISDIFEKEFGFKKISIGDLLRKEIQRNTKIGRKIKETLKHGKNLIDNEISYKIIYSDIQNNKKIYPHIILDGFPRCMEQVNIIERENFIIDKFFYFNASKKNIINRLLNRRMCNNPNCNKIYNLITMPPKIKDRCDLCSEKITKRNDDNPNSIKNRYDIFLNLTTKVIDYYNNKEKIIKINANNSISKVYSDVAKLLH